MIVHVQCLLRIDGSILDSVFLTSSFCAVPESSGSSSAVSSSLYIFVHVVLGTQTALVQLIALSQQCMASFKDLHTIGGSHRHWWLFGSVDSYTVVSNQFRLQLATHHQTVAAYVMVSYYVTLVVTVYGEFFSESNSSPHKMSREFLHSKPNKIHVLWTWVL